MSQEKTLTGDEGAIVPVNGNTNLSALSSNSNSSSRANANTSYDYNALTSTLGKAIPDSLTAFSSAFQEWQKTKQKTLASKDKMIKGLMTAAANNSSQVVKMQENHIQMINKTMEQFTGLCQKFHDSIYTLIKDSKNDLERFQRMYDTADENLAKKPDSDFWQQRYAAAADNLSKKHGEMSTFITVSMKENRKSLKETQENFNELVLRCQLSNNELIDKALELTKRLLDLAERVCGDLAAPKTQPSALPAATSTTSASLPTANPPKALPPANSQGSAQTDFFKQKLSSEDKKYLRMANALVKSVSKNDDMFIKKSAANLKIVLEKCLNADLITPEDRTAIDDEMESIKEMLAENQETAAP